MEPITRKEMFLAKAGGQSVKTPEPITREEMFLQRIAENGGGSGGGGGGSASIDVIATVGQTIVVKAVDANGKPTKWEAAEYQEKICGSELGYIIPETTVNYTDEDMENDGQLVVDELLVLGETYVVNWNGVDYTCVCKEKNIEGVTAQCIGNALPLGGEDTGEPFAIFTGIVGGSKMGGVLPADESVTNFTFSVKGRKPVPIPVQYVSNAFPYYIEVTAETVDTTTTYSCIDTVAEITAIYNSGRSIVARVTDGAERHHYNLFNAVITAAGMAFGFSFPTGGSTSHHGLQFMPQADGTFAITATNF